MNAKGARKLYFEFYVIFEDVIRRLSKTKIVNYQSKTKNLKIIIKDLKKLNFEKQTKSRYR